MGFFGEVTRAWYRVCKLDKNSEGLKKKKKRKESLVAKLDFR